MATAIYTATTAMHPSYPNGRQERIETAFGYADPAEGETLDEIAEFAVNARIVDEAIASNPALATAIAAMLDRAHAFGAGTIGSGLENVVDEALGEMDHTDLAPHCGEGRDAFATVMGCGFSHVDECRIFVTEGSLTGTADAWSVEARVRIDTDCGESNRNVRITGRTLPGLTQIHSVERAVPAA